MEFFLKKELSQNSSHSQMTIYESEQNKSLFQIYTLRACTIHNTHWKDYQRAYFSKKKSEPKGMDGGLNKNSPK